MWSRPRHPRRVDDTERGKRPRSTPCSSRERPQQPNTASSRLRSSGLAGLDAPMLGGAGLRRRAAHTRGAGCTSSGSMRETDARPCHRQLVPGARSCSTPTRCSPRRPRCWPMTFPCGAPTPIVRRCCVQSIAAAGWSCFWVRAQRWGRGLVAGSPWGPSVSVADAVAQLAGRAPASPRGWQAPTPPCGLGVVSTSTISSEAVEAIDSWPRRSRAVVDAGRSPTVAASRWVSPGAPSRSRAGLRACPRSRSRWKTPSLVARVDFLVDGTRVVVEFDGKVKYGSGDPCVLWAEKRREDQLRGLGYVVVRITWADLERAGGRRRPVRAALATAAGRTTTQTSRRQKPSRWTPEGSGCPPEGSGRRERWVR